MDLVADGQVQPHFISLGAGVQSSTMALMAAHSEINPMPTAAIFSDTQWEPPQVYDWLAWLEQQLPFPVMRVTAGSLRDDVLLKQNADTGRFASVPWHITNPDGSTSMGRRQCTSEYKIQPLIKARRRLMGYPPRVRIPAKSCVTWIGISIDEAARMKDSLERWNVNRWPLIEAGMSRHDCLRWMDKHGYPAPPKSSCIGCPFHSDAEWRRIKADPVLWADAVAIDAAIRQPVRGMKGEQFMHRSRKPLAEVDLTTLEDHGQLNMWNIECEGMCGV
jgi:hypothetical protein